MIPEAFKYGAAELKRVYVTNLWKALGISAGIHLLLILLYVFGISAGKSAEESRYAASGPTTLTKLPPPPPPTTNEPPPPPPMVPPNLQSGAGTGGVTSVAGNPVPTPDVDLAPDAPQFASTDEINVAQIKAGDGTGFGGLDNGNGFAPTIDAGSVNIDSGSIERTYQAWEFEPGQEPQVNYDQLQANVVYPERAKRNNIQGTVVLRVVIGPNGHALSVDVIQSESSLLDNAAVDAAKKTTYTPGIQNGKPVKASISIPVRFELN